MDESTRQAIDELGWRSTVAHFTVCTELPNEAWGLCLRLNASASYRRLLLNEAVRGQLVRLFGALNRLKYLRRTELRPNPTMSEPIVLPVKNTVDTKLPGGINSEMPSRGCSRTSRD